MVSSQNARDAFVLPHDLIFFPPLLLGFLFFFSFKQRKMKNCGQSFTELNMYSVYSDTKQKSSKCSHLKNLQLVTVCSFFFILT